MARIIKWIFLLAVAGFLALVGYAYLAPVFGIDFAPPTREIRQDIILEPR
ncbi:MAG: hypothetical protein Kow0058_14050 [Roseovarius sp.]